MATVDSFSFPSGHTSRAIMVACLVAVRFWASYPGLVAMAAIWAVLVALSRVVLGRHYATDVLGGLVLGVTVTAISTSGKWSASGFHIGGGMLVTLNSWATKNVWRAGN